ncbi:cobalamin biosynthesis protein CbiX [Frigidibacter sp. RF13]|uniref:CbiX/SirB N-terminal domain-containing protein n=1 Tax=Frigidibacter sp. RF13 TaxID=2997340 RepID=UPI0022709DD5|nr:CbiX/SirB N-terminal domain-containing protein [Frigidibacter sp. RF13]MCY1125707.1 cobalamin biosynthesis protein CbiX [Frigidibacter sp. RF13]
MKPSALIVAHGQPSDPEPPEAEISALAASVGALIPGWRIAGATLAAPGALDRALDGLGAPLVFPFFMADGWFTRSELPRRLVASGHPGLAILPAFGLLPGIAPLAVDIARKAARARGWATAETALLLAAHGSGRSRASAEATRAIAATVTGFAAVRLGFVEEAPHVTDAASGLGPRALCLPLFVARWGHVQQDIPAALRTAGFAGALLDPLGTHPIVPSLIARALADRLIAQGNTAE